MRRLYPKGLARMMLLNGCHCPFQLYPGSWIDALGEARNVNARTTESCDFRSSQDVRIQPDRTSLRFYKVTHVLVAAAGQNKENHWQPNDRVKPRRACERSKHAREVHRR